MYLRRKIDDYLENWKTDKDHMPLIVKGARQIGKTESILHFASLNYEHVININFALEPKYKIILNDGYDVESIVKNITLIDPGKTFVPGVTLILFDEIQECPDLATALKAFKIDGRYDVICSGSMLGVNYKKIHSNSVGYKSDYEMYSMDFEEFLWANGYGQQQIDDLLSNMVNNVPFSDTELMIFRKLFLEYSVLGGMPAVVKQYVETDSFSKTLEIQEQIKLDYEEDIRKYAEGLDQTKIVSVYRSVPSQLAKEYKKFQYSCVKKNARSRDFAGCIDWLKDAGVVSICYCMNYPELPIKGNYDYSRFKLYYPDTGLLVASLDEEAQEDLRTNKNLGIYKGALYENFVAEAFLKQGLELCYFKKENSTLEEDFFVRDRNGLIPVEVKAGSNRSKSLRELIDNKKYSDIHCGIKLGDYNIGHEMGIYTFPYFCSFLIKRFLNEKIDLG